MLAGRCDLDGAELICREDDKDEVIRARLRTYAELTGPAIEHYKSKTYFRIDGCQSPDDVFEEIESALESVSELV
jgi:adenylate kinase